MADLLDETWEDREAARQRGYRLRELRPTARAQERYPLEDFPCARCANPNEGLPHLIDNGCELGWEHQHKSPGSSARSGCPRFNASSHYGPPRPGTVASLWKGRCQSYRVRTEDEYQSALEAVEQEGADDAWLREGLGAKR